jgi:hypothetical protein
MKRVTCAYSFYSVPKTTHHTMLFKCFNAIVRTAWVESTATAQPGADHFLVELDDKNKNVTHPDCPDLVPLVIALLQLV